MYLLETKGLKKKFGGITAVDNLFLNVKENTILGLVGPNGSGKTTLFNLISGFHPIDEGEIYFKGERISGLKPFQIARRGIGRTFQITTVFPEMAVLGNMLSASPIGVGERAIKKALELLEFFDVAKLKDEYAGNLSYGQQKLLELARLLMRDTELLLLDEPTAGINPVLIERLLDRIRELRREKNKTFVIIEHNMSVISEICDEVVVLDFGEKIAEGSPQEIQQDERVINAYLGGVV